MSALKQIYFQIAIFIFFVAISLISVNFAVGLIYCLVFVSGVFRKEYAHRFIVFFIALFLDLRLFAPAGITPVLIAVLYALSRKFKISLQNFGINVAYLFASLCLCKLVLFALVKLMGYHFDMFSNMMQVFWTLWIYAVCRFFQDVRRDARYV
jgi:hypothetical protein